MIQEVKKERMSDLIDLWKEAFGDEECAKWLYSEVFDSMKVITYCVSDEIVSMLHYIPCTLNKGTRTYNGVYLYALATRQQSRGKGYMSQLMDEAIRLAKSDRKDFLFLIPAKEALFEYYQQRGFDKKILIGDLEESTLVVEFDRCVEQFVTKEDAAYGGLEPNCMAANGIDTFTVGLMKEISPTGVWKSEDLGELNSLDIIGNIPY